MAMNISPSFICATKNTAVVMGRDLQNIRESSHIFMPISFQPGVLPELKGKCQAICGITR